MCKHLLVSLFGIFLCSTVAKEVWRQGKRHQVSMKDDGTYAVWVNGEIWLENKAYLTSLHVYGMWCYGSDGLLLNNVTNVTGKDPILGIFNAVIVSYHCPLDIDRLGSATDTPMLCAVKYYSDFDLFIFETTFPEGGVGMAQGEPGSPGAPVNVGEFWSSTNISFSFPSFEFLPNSKLASLGYVEWHGRFSADSNSYGIGLSEYKGGIEGGPLVLFDAKSSRSDALVIGPFKHFKHLFSTKYQIAWPAKATALGFGLSGYVNDVGTPNTFSAQFGLTGSMFGVTDAVETWGSTLRVAYGTQRMQNDLVNTKLGYWTDNGAYYYRRYWPKHLEQRPQDVLVNVKKALDKANVPIAYMQLDPWWYPFQDGCTEWTARKDYFPNGLPWFREQLGIPLLLYAAYFSAQNVYAANKSFDFLTSLNFSVGWPSWAHSPIAAVVPSQSAQFYDAIMSQHASSMGAFELDFTDFQFLLFKEMQQSVSNSAELWFKGIADAALKHHVSIQLCMELPNDLLQSVMFPAVTNARASEDDFPTAPNRWNIAQTSLLMRALDICPFFDDIWTTADQPGNPYDTSSNNINLRTVISTFSAGPVGISDGIDMTNASLIRRSCRDDGVLLKPSKPAVPVDATYVPNRIQSGYVWNTHSLIDSVAYYHVIAIDVAESYELSPDDLYPMKLHPQAGKFVAGMWGFPNCSSGSRASLCLQWFDAAHTLKIETGSMSGKEHRFIVYSINPVFSNGWALLGEREKIVAVSPQRFVSVQASGAGLTVEMEGSAGEKLTLWFVKFTSDTTGTIYAVDVEIGADGRATATTPTQK